MKSKIWALHNKIILYTAGLFILQQSLTWAAPLELSLQESIALALRNNHAIFMAATDKEKSEWSYREAKTGKIPSVSLGSSYNTKDFSKGGELNNNLKLSWQLYSGGKVEGQIKQAELGMTTADILVEKAKQQIKLDATYN